MAKLVYTTITSLDGYTADANGNFEWGAPDTEVLTFLNQLEEGFGTALYGRKMYETMVFWETFDAEEGHATADEEFARIWRNTAKVVYSRTLGEVSSARTRLERSFDPSAVRQMKETAGQDLSIGGPELAGQALAAGLVDEMHLFITPLTVGGGKAALPDDMHVGLELLDVDRFAGGVVHLHYRVGS